MNKKIYIILVLCSFCISSIWSQKTLKGTVSDENNEPLIGVTVTLKGTTKGTITDLNGDYTIDTPEDGGILVFSFVGLETEEVEIADQTIIDIQLLPDAEQIEAVVVTALGIKKEEKALGYSVQVVKSEDLGENKSIDIITSLQGKVAGLQIAQTGTGTGGSTYIQLRGLSSLSQGQNAPIWIIDGVPIDNTSLGSGDVWEQRDYANAASEINPDDIESITVLKGANAAALYGSRGLNGAIVITTKRATENQPVTVTYTGNFTFTDAYEFYDLQNEYGRGTNGLYFPRSGSSWGPKMEGQDVMHWRVFHYDDSSQGETYQMLPQPNRLEEFYRTGKNMNHSIVIAGGGTNSTTRLSISHINKQGITPSHEIATTSANLFNTFKYNKWELTTKVNYLRTEGNNRPRMGNYSTNMNLLTMPTDISLESLRPEADSVNWQINWFGNSNAIFNPYYVIYYDNVNSDIKNRLINMANLSYSLTNWLKIRSKTGFDYSAVTNESIKRNYNQGGGEYQIVKRNFYIINTDLMLMIDKSFDKLGLQTNLGTELYYRKTDVLSAWTKNIAIDEEFSAEFGGNTTVEQGFNEKEIHSVFGDLTLSYNNYLFLNITGRNDWSSTLPSDRWSYFYPSFNLSGVVSDMLSFPEFVTFLKFRGSYAIVGNDTGPYQLHSLITGFYNSYLGLLSYELPGNKPIDDLKPEKKHGIDLGLDCRFFDNRLGIDFTYYYDKTFNQIISKDLNLITGYGSKFVNVGQIDNKGIEIVLSTVPLKFRDFRWELNFNYSKNENTVIDLQETPSDSTFIKINGNDNFRAYEGRPWGDIYGNKYERDDDGNILIDEFGLPYDTPPTQLKYLGNISPDWIGSISNTLTYKGISLNAHINIKIGGDIYSSTDARLVSNGSSNKTIDYRDGGLVVEGMSAELIDDEYVISGKNTVETNAQEYWTTVAGIMEEFIYDGSYVKLQQVSMGYSMPHKLLKKVPFLPISKLKFSLVASNLFYLYKNTPEGISPEGALNNLERFQYFEMGGLPNTRNYGFNVSITF